MIKLLFEDHFPSSILHYDYLLLTFIEHFRQQNRLLSKVQESDIIHRCEGRVNIEAITDFHPAML